MKRDSYTFTSFVEAAHNLQRVSDQSRRRRRGAFADGCRHGLGLEDWTEDAYAEDGAYEWEQNEAEQDPDDEYTEENEIPPELDEAYETMEEAYIATGF